MASRFDNVHLRRLRRVSALSCLVLSAGTAHAMGPRPALRVLPVEKAAAGSPSDLHFAVDRAVEEIDVESTLVADGAVVAETKTVGASVLMRDDVGEGMAAPDGYAVVEKDGSLRLKVRRDLSLVPGVYAERLLVTLLVADADAPVEVSGFRYFSVSDAGIAPISAEEYSAAHEHLEVLEDKVRMRVGAAVHDDKSAASEVSGFDVPLHKVEDKPTHPDLSEAHEK
jgi:hypothetical protein